MIAGTRTRRTREVEVTHRFTPAFPGTNRGQPRLSAIERSTLWAKGNQSGHRFVPRRTGRGTPRLPGHPNRLTMQHDSKRHLIEMRWQSKARAVNCNRYVVTNAAASCSGAAASSGVAACSQVALIDGLESVGPVGALNVLADFALPGDQRDWRVENDTFVGGVSQSVFQVDGGCGIFAGVVASGRGGGFASVRTQLGSRVSCDTDAVAIRVRGDGKRYQFRVCTCAPIDGPAFKHDFETVLGQWTVVRLPARGFVSSFRERELAFAPRLELGCLRQIGFLIADEQLGRFALEIDWIATL